MVGQAGTYKQAQTLCRRVLGNAWELATSARLVWIYRPRRHIERLETRMMFSSSAFGARSTRQHG